MRWEQPSNLGYWDRQNLINSTVNKAALQTSTIEFVLSDDTSAAKIAALKTTIQRLHALADPEREDNPLNSEFFKTLLKKTPTQDYKLKTLKNVSGNGVSVATEELAERAEITNVRLVNSMIELAGTKVTVSNLHVENGVVVTFLDDQSLLDAVRFDKRTVVAGSFKGTIARNSELHCLARDWHIGDATIELVNEIDLKRRFKDLKFSWALLQKSDPAATTHPNVDLFRRIARPTEFTYAELLNFQTGMRPYFSDSMAVQLIHKSTIPTTSIQHAPIVPPRGSMSHASRVRNAAFQITVNPPPPAPGAPAPIVFNKMIEFPTLPFNWHSPAFTRTGAARFAWRFSRSLSHPSWIYELDASGNPSREISQHLLPQDALVDLLFMVRNRPLRRGIGAGIPGSGALGII